MDRGQFIDQSAAKGTTLGDLIRLYMKDVTDRRPGEASRAAERSRLERFLREEKDLCAYAVANLTPEHFEAYATGVFISRSVAGGSLPRTRRPFPPAL